MQLYPGLALAGAVELGVALPLGQVLVEAGEAEEVGGPGPARHLVQYSTVQGSVQYILVQYSTVYITL